MPPPNAPVGAPVRMRVELESIIEGSTARANSELLAFDMDYQATEVRLPAFAYRWTEYELGGYLAARRFTGIQGRPAFGIVITGKAGRELMRLDPSSSRITLQLATLRESLAEESWDLWEIVCPVPNIDFQTFTTIGDNTALVTFEADEVTLSRATRAAPTYKIIYQADYPAGDIRYLKNEADTDLTRIGPDVAAWEASL